MIDEFINNLQQKDCDKRSTLLTINREKVYLHFNIILYIIWRTD